MQPSKSRKFMTLLERHAAQDGACQTAIANLGISKASGTQIKNPTCYDPDICDASHLESYLLSPSKCGA